MRDSRIERPVGRVGRWKKRYHNARRKPDAWILDEQKVAFIQIRKVGSRSAKFAICKYIQNRGPDGADPTPEEILALDKAYAHHVATSHLASLAVTHYVFTIVRNPLARLYSCYAHKIVRYRELGRENRLQFYGLHLDMDFGQFVRRVAEIPDIESNTHFRSMVPFLSHRGELIPQTICKLENLQSDWLTVQQHIAGFPDLPRLNQTNTSDKPVYTQYYDRTLAEIARERYREDIELLGYAAEVDQFIASLPV